MASQKYIIIALVSLLSVSTSVFANGVFLQEQDRLYFDNEVIIDSQSFKLNIGGLQPRIGSDLTLDFLGGVELRSPIETSLKFGQNNGLLVNNEGVLLDSKDMTIVAAPNSAAIALRAADGSQNGTDIFLNSNGGLDFRISNAGLSATEKDSQKFGFDLANTRWYINPHLMIGNYIDVDGGVNIAAPVDNFNNWGRFLKFESNLSTPMITLPAGNIGFGFDVNGKNFVYRDLTAKIDRLIINVSDTSNVIFDTLGKVDSPLLTLGSVQVDSWLDVASTIKLVPSGLIAPFVGGCPASGWSRYSGLDGLMPRAASSNIGATGGSDLVQLGNGSLDVNGHSGDGAVASYRMQWDNDTAFSNPLTLAQSAGAAQNSANVLPPHRTIIFCKKL